MASAIGTCINGFLIKAEKLDATDFLTLRCLVQLMVMPALIKLTKEEFWPAKASKWVKAGIIIQGIDNLS